jgi:hypothetical protein
MTYQPRARQRWQAGACFTLAALATVAGAIATTAVTSTPALADVTNSATPTSTVAPAAATTSTTIPADVVNRLAWVKANSARLIANRVTSLNAAITVVQDLSYLGPDGTTLVTGMQTDITGLQALGTTIAGDLTVPTAAQGRAEIFTQFRVYLLVLPVTRDVAAADRVANVLLPAVQKAITQLQAEEGPSNQSVLGPLVSDMQAQAQTATTTTSGLSAQLLAFTPSEWDSNHHLLLNAALDIRNADRALQAADKDMRQAERYLNTGRLGRLGHRGHGHGQGATTTTTSTTVAPTTTSTTVDPTTTSS